MSSAYDLAVLADSPVGYWKCDEVSGNLADSSGNGYTLTPAGTAMTYQQAALAPGLGKGVLLNAGSASNGSVPAAYSGDITVEAWLSYTGAAAFTRHFFKPTSGEWVVGANAGSSWFWQGSASDTFTPAPNATAAYLIWEFIVATKVATVYLNNVALGSHTDASSYTTPTVAGVVLGHTTSSNSWQGALSNLAFYHGVLSQARKNAHYAAANGAGGGGIGRYATLARPLDLSAGLIL